MSGTAYTADELITIINRGRAESQRRRVPVHAIERRGQIDFVERVTAHDTVVVASISGPPICSSKDCDEICAIYSEIEPLIPELERIRSMILIGRDGKPRQNGEEFAQSLLAMLVRSAPPWRDPEPTKPSLFTKVWRLIWRGPPADETPIPAKSTQP